MCGYKVTSETGPPREITTGRETLSKTCPLLNELYLSFNIAGNVAVT